MDFEICVVLVGLARKHGLDLLFRRLAAQLAKRFLGLRDDRRIALLFTEFDELDVVVELLLEAAQAIDAVIELLALPHQLLRLGRVVPERRVFRLVVQPVQSSYRLVPVKDASSAGLWPA